VYYGFLVLWRLLAAFGQIFFFSPFRLKNLLARPFEIAQSREKLDAPKPSSL
jgi:hypothetical protein